MQNLLITLLIVLCLGCQAVAQNIATHEAPGTVVSAMLYEPYVAAFLSLILLIATLIWTHLMIIIIDINNSNPSFCPKT